MNVSAGFSENISVWFRGVNRKDLSSHGLHHAVGQSPGAAESRQGAPRSFRLPSSAAVRRQRSDASFQCEISPRPLQGLPAHSSGHICIPGPLFLWLPAPWTEQLPISWPFTYRRSQWEHSDHVILSNKSLPISIKAFYRFSSGEPWLIPTLKWKFSAFLKTNLSFEAVLSPIENLVCLPSLRILGMERGY